MVVGRGDDAPTEAANKVTDYANAESTWRIARVRHPDLGESNRDGWGQPGAGINDLQSKFCPHWIRAIATGRVKANLATGR